jgi:tetratricopeptide (TPR) repeat protein
MTCKNRFSVLAAVLALQLSAVPCARALSREYVVAGKVVGTDQQPIAGVTLSLRHRESIFRYKTKTDKNGDYLAVGLPHGTFDVELSKKGYRTVKVEWRYPTPQQQLLRVTAEPVVLVSEEQARRAEVNRRLRGKLAEAMKLLEQRDIEGALAIAQKMLEDKPDDANGLFITGMCLLEQQRVDEAMPALEKAAELLPDYVPAHVRLGVCYQHKGMVDEALASYEHALALEPANVAALYNAGAMLYGASRGAEALPYLERALAAGARNANTYEMAGYLVLQAGNFETALAHFEESRALTTDEAQAASLDEILPGLREHVQKAEAEDEE